MCGCVGIISGPVQTSAATQDQNKPARGTIHKKETRSFIYPGVFYATFSGYGRCNIQLGGKRKQTDKTTTNKTTKEVEHFSIRHRGAR